MSKTRRKFTAEQKFTIVRWQVKGKESHSSIAEQLLILSIQIHQWIAMAADEAEQAFVKKATSERATQGAEAKINEFKEQRIKKLVKCGFKRTK